MASEKPKPPLSKGRFFIYIEGKMKNQNISEVDLKAMRHSCEHVLHQAMADLFPGLKRAMGPATDEGFYHDFDYEGKVSEDDFPKIEKRMLEIIKADLPITRKEISVNEAKKLFKDNPYKLDWIEQIVKKGEKATVYWTGIPGQPGSDVDLCRGPHVESTGKIGPFKLLSIAGAYWHGDEKNKMLTRIYGTCFPTQKELDNFLKLIEESEKRDHRKLGKELDLFSTNPLTGQGLVLWHPKLATTRNIVEQFWKEEHIKRGYQLVYTPHLAGMDMFVKTRHYIKYIDYMFPVMLHQNIEGESKGDYATDEQLKPMNCPNHVQIFKFRPRSYRELPLRMGELGTVYRYERAGVLHGLTRVRGFTQDDSHIFCTPEQVIDEVRGIIELTRYIYEEIIGFKDYQAYLATRPAKYLGSPEMWEFAQNSLKKAMDLEKVTYKIDEGQGVFYGPKIDSKIKDSLGREWQLGTIQFDFNLPTYSETTNEEIEQFWNLKTFKDKFKTKERLAKYLKRMGRGLDVKFIDKDGKEKPVVMIHRTILGSMERFFGILIEHYAGAFPVWLAPVQVKIIPISDKSLEYAQKIQLVLKENEIRVELDERSEKMQAKIRDAETEKIPYMIVVGPREAESNQVNVRVRGEKVLGLMGLDQLIKLLKEDIAKKRQV